jgi:hypothetical protein
VAPRPVSAASVDDYVTAVHRALTLVQFAERGDAPSRLQAISVLTQATGKAQPEILADLRADPPRLVDADQRLQALFTALQSRVDTPDPTLAAQRLHRILSSSRYAGLTTGPSLLDQIEQAIGDLIQRWLLWLGIQSTSLGIPILLLIALAIAVIAVIVVRSALSPIGRQAKRRPMTAADRAATDFFPEADRLAAAGDYRAALRMLAAGVAVRLSDEHSWNRSPLTVRELFARSPRADTLRPLLLSFEEGIYGHRPVDAAAYARAAAAADPYRRQVA